MAGRTYHHERWSQDDDELLRKMSESRKSLTLMIVKLNKPMASIKSRAEELHINIPGTSIARASEPKAICIVVGT
jgi:hypothetical protein